MSEISEQVRRLIAQSDHLVPSECPVEKRRLELAEERERKAREAREQKAPDWTAWYAAIDARLEQHFFSGDRGVGGALKDAIGQALGTRCTELRKEFRRAIEETVDAFGAEIAALERRLKAVPGKLPVAKSWSRGSVVYQAEVVSHNGASYQALRDTAQTPGDSGDWICVARAGRDGQTLNICGSFNAGERYAKFDVIEYDGGSFVALHDDPGIPGDPGWQLLSRTGSRGPAGETGPRGERGVRGARGEDAPQVLNWTLDPVHYRLVPTLSNGKAGVPVELRPLFERFCEEAIGPAVAAAVTAALQDAARSHPQPVA